MHISAATVEKLHWMSSVRAICLIRLNQIKTSGPLVGALLAVCRTGTGCRKRVLHAAVAAGEMELFCPGIVPWSASTGCQQRSILA